MCKGSDHAADALKPDGVAVFFVVPLIVLVPEEVVGLAATPFALLRGLADDRVVDVAAAVAVASAVDAWMCHCYSVIALVSTVGIRRCSGSEMKGKTCRNRSTITGHTRICTTSW